MRLVLFSLMLFIVFFEPIYSILPRLVNIKITKPNKFRLSDDKNNNDSLPNIPPISSIPIAPGDSESVIVAKIQLQTVIAKGYLDIQLTREKRKTQIGQELLDTKVIRGKRQSQIELEMLQSRTKIDQALILATVALTFVASFVLFGISLRDGLTGKVSDIGKYIDSVMFNKMTYIYGSGVFVCIGLLIRFREEMVEYAKQLIRFVIKKLFK